MEREELSLFTASSMSTSVSDVAKDEDRVAVTYQPVSPSLDSQSTICSPTDFFTTVHHPLGSIVSGEAYALKEVDDFTSGPRSMNPWNHHTVNATKDGTTLVSPKHSKERKRTQGWPSSTLVATTCKPYDSLSKYIIPIDDEVLEALRVLTPPSLGGTMTRPISWSEDSREYTVSEPVCLSSDWYHHAVSNLRSRLMYICNAAHTEHWEAPPHASLLKEDGIWPLYILTVHQWFLACVAPGVHPNIVHAAGSDVSTQHLEAITRCETNVYGPRSLWAAMQSASLRSEQGSSDITARTSNTTDARKPSSLSPPRRSNDFLVRSAEQVNTTVPTHHVATGGTRGAANTVQMDPATIRAPAPPSTFGLQKEVIPSLGKLISTCYKDDKTKNSLKDTTMVESEAANNHSETVSQKTVAVPLPTCNKAKESPSPDGVSLVSADDVKAAGRTVSTNIAKQAEKLPLTPSHNGIVSVNVEGAASVSTGSVHKTVSTAPGSKNAPYRWYCYLAPLSRGTKEGKPQHLNELMVAMIHDTSNRVLWCIDPDIITLTLAACGRYDAYAWALVLNAVQAVIPDCGWSFAVPAVLRTADQQVPSTQLSSNVVGMIDARSRHAIRVFNEFLDHPPWGREKAEYIAHMVLSHNTSAINDTLNDLFGNIWCSAFKLFKPNEYKRMEGTLIAMCGDPNVAVRNRAIILLNSLYDGHDWQREVPLVPVIKQVGDPFVITVTLEDTADPRCGKGPSGVFLILSAPSFYRKSPLDVYSYHEFHWTPTSRTDSGSALLFHPALDSQGVRRWSWTGQVKFGVFSRCGFFDWRVVRMSPSCGSWEPVQTALCDLQRAQSGTSLALQLPWTPKPEMDGSSPPHFVTSSTVLGTVYPHPQRTAEMLRRALQLDSAGFEKDASRTFPLQGRFIVQPRHAGDEQVHQILIDQFGCQVRATTGELCQRGSFLSVAHSLPSLRRQGITLLSLNGVLARDTGECRFPTEGGVSYEREDASPFAVTCRSTVSNICGGGPGFTRLIHEAHRLGMKVLCESTSYVSASHPHRKYEPFLLKYIDSDGQRHVGVSSVLCSASPGPLCPLSCTYALNYRDVRCWDLMTDEMEELINTFNIDGFLLTQCEQWPIMFYPDEKELTRLDADGINHYSVLERFMAPVVLPSCRSKNVEKHCDPSGFIDERPSHISKEQKVEGQVETDCGFWSAEPVCKAWANPFLVKVCKTLWRNHPDLMLIGECTSGSRQSHVYAATGSKNLADVAKPSTVKTDADLSPVVATRDNICDDDSGDTLFSSSSSSSAAALARSGVIPQLYELPLPLAKLFGKVIDPVHWTVMDEDTWHPVGTPHHQRCSDLRPSAVLPEIARWFDVTHRQLPEGAIMVQSSCPPFSPLPGLLYGRGAWPAVDLLFLMPDVPSTVDGEIQGESFRLAVLAFPSTTMSSSTLFSTAVTLGHHHDASSARCLTATAEDDGIVPSHCSKAQSMAALANPYTNVQAVREGLSSPTHQQSAIITPEIRSFKAVRGLASYEPLTHASRLEEEHLRRLGPEYGFDLRKIGHHYDHRRWLRHHLKLFRQTGIVVPLYAMYHGVWFSRVLAFLRFDTPTGEFALVCINFSECALDNVSLSLRALAPQFRDMNLGPDAVFLRMNLFDLLHPGKETNREDIPLLGADWRLGDLSPLPVASMSSKIGHSGETDMSATPSSAYSVYSLPELLNEPQWVALQPYQTQCFGFRPFSPEEQNNSGITAELYHSALMRLKATVRSCMTHTVVKHERLPPHLERALQYNFVIKTLLASVYASGLSSFVHVLRHIRRGLQESKLTLPVLGDPDAIANVETHHSIVSSSTTAGRAGHSKNVSLHDLLVDSGLFSSAAQTFDAQRWKRLCSPEGGGALALLAEMDHSTRLAEILLAKMLAVARNTTYEDGIETFAQEFVDANALGPIVFVTTELGKWSTVGGLGVMVDELSRTLAQDLGQTVYVITPYYNCDTKGQPIRLECDGIQYQHNIQIEAGRERVELGVHEGIVSGVNLIFLHNSRFFPHVYPNWNVPDALRFLAVMAKGSLEVLCQKRLIPQLIITNDWPAGLVAAYAKNPVFFGSTFYSSTLFHIVHNLDTHYEGRIYADRNAAALYGWITELPTDLLVDSTWSQFLFNPSRCALLTSDAWGTVSPSYRDELRRPGGSPLAPLLTRYRTPFAYPNGVPLQARRAQLQALHVTTHEEAKAWIQKTYFGFEDPDLAIPLFAFIGRITEQKGVHHIVDGAEQLIRRYQNRIHLLIGGRVNWSESYSAYCGHKLRMLRQKYPYCVWADPDEFFTRGPLVNLGADVGLMPSKFEPGGIVQHEFFIAGTPVLAFRTGGLKDTVYEFDGDTLVGNGFTFEAYQLGDFLYAMERAYRIVQDPIKYKRLRANASYSPISCEQVAKAWLTEFCRLRRRLPVNTERIEELTRSIQRSTKGLPAESLDRTTLRNLKSRTVSLTHPHDHDDDCLKDPLSSNQAKVLPQRDKLLTDENTSIREQQNVPAIAPINPSELLPHDESPDVIQSQPSHQRPPRVIPTRIRFWPKTIGSSTYRPRTVAVSGSFDDWQIRHPMLWDNAVQGFTTTLALKPGRYYYKLILDRSWTLNPDVVVEKDPASGILNNVLIVE